MARLTLNLQEKQNNHLIGGAFQLKKAPFMQNLGSSYLSKNSNSAKMLVSRLS